MFSTLKRKTPELSMAHSKRLPGEQTLVPPLKITSTGRPPEDWNLSELCFFSLGLWMTLLESQLLTL